MVQWFCLISWRLFDIFTSYFLEYESVQPDVWPQNKCRSLWPIFHGPVIVPFTLKTISCRNIIIWDYESVWPTHDLKIDIWTSSLGKMGPYEWTFDLLNKCMSLWPIFHVFFFIRLRMHVSFLFCFSLLCYVNSVTLLVYGLYIIIYLKTFAHYSR